MEGAEAAALDARILAAIAAYSLDAHAFDRLACDIFAHQLRANAPYAAFARSRGITRTACPNVPRTSRPCGRGVQGSGVEHRRPRAAAIWFQTSGTTAATAGRHYLATTELYEAALLAGFDRALLPDGARLRYLLLVPDARKAPHSSLGFMMDRVAAARGDGFDERFIDGDTSTRRRSRARSIPPSPTASRSASPRRHSRSSPHSKRSTRAAAATCCRPARG